MKGCGVQGNHPDCLKIVTTFFSIGNHPVFELRYIVITKLICLKPFLLRAVGQSGAPQD